MSLILALGRGFLNFIYFFHRLVPVKNRISFISRQNPTPLPDVKLLSAELRRQSPDTEIVICCKMIGPGVSGKIKYFFHMITRQMHLFATSGVVILDGYCISACVLKHKKNLKIVQMWHAMGAFKKFGWASVGQEEGYSLRIARGMRMHAGYSVVFAGSEECARLLAPAFGCSRDLMKVMPLPRCDLLKSAVFQAENKKRILERYPYLEGKKVILYAPTFRKGKDISPYVNALIQAQTREDYALVIKLHPLDKEKISSDLAVIDGEFSTMKMLCAADYVITDYSAVVFEAALAGKPIFRYVPDQEEYEKGRGFLIDPDREIPAYTAVSAPEILRAVYEEKYDSAAIKLFAQKFAAAGEDNTGEMAKYILGLSVEGQS